MTDKKDQAEAVQAAHVAAWGAMEVERIRERSAATVARIEAGKEVEVERLRGRSIRRAERTKLIAGVLIALVTGALATLGVMYRYQRAPAAPLAETVLVKAGPAEVVKQGETVVI